MDVSAKSKKTRPEAKLKLLPEALQLEIAEYGRSHTLQATLAWLAGKQVTTSRTALGEFLKECRDAEKDNRVLDRLANGSRFARRVDEKVEAGASVELRTIAALQKAIIMDVQARGEFSEEAVEMCDRMLGRVIEIEKLRLKNEEGSRDERRVKVLEQRAEKADQAEKVAGDAGMTAEEKEVEMKRIFGM